MASSDKSKRKILKAKKTMPASCREQVELLNKSKNVDALKIAAIGNNGNNVSSGNQNSNTCIRSSIERSDNAFLLSSNKNSVCSQNLIKQLESVDVKTRLEYTGKQAVCPNQKSSKIVGSPCMPIKQKAKNSQNTFENHLECHTNVSKSFCEHKEDYKVKSVYPPTNKFKIPKSTNSLDGKRIDKIVSYLETNSDSESHGKRQNNLSANTHFVPIDKIPKLANPVIPNNCAADILKSEESCRNRCSSIIHCESMNSTRLSSLDSDGHNQKKRMFSENKENVKRLKTSEQMNENICVTLEKQTALLEQVKHLIREEIGSMNCKVFDNKLNELNERIGKTQCNNKHEAVADELFAKIAKLQRRIKAVWNCLEPDMLSSEMACKVTNSETMDLDRNQESDNSQGERETSVNNRASEKINLSQDHDNAVSESNDDVLLISVDIPNLTSPLTSNTTGYENIKSRISNHLPCAEVAVPVKDNDDFVIDLTEDTLSTENSVSGLESFTKAVSSSKESTSPVARNTAQDPESFEHLPPLPEPPPLLPELVDKIRDTLPPQKPELKVKRVLRPRGIALTWNITKINPKCAPVESYHLFLCHENPNDQLIWKKIGEIKALPLPMACTLSRFLASNKYYFTVQSKDIFGRYGPFCDIKSIPGFSENLT
ncbi:activating transcription factor 7-interacting protein 2 isoform X2 [Sorex araneus]|uniref:activating transcription factor 7-interacting protein 2 isoform X2 n=1 Tax=Sorex araneus TaxID=42254 RepID=UPI0024334D3A|nr:activating transcription factor 7-interacting protein 2 isoform X2 [Sorex araneus]